MKFAVLLLSVFLSFASRAFTVASLEPYGRMNTSKTYYFISVPENPRSNKGYTAVFDAKTKQLKFKLDHYFVNRQLLLSDNGEKLVQVDSRINSSTETCSATIYSKEGQEKSVQLFQRKSRNVDDIFYVSNLLDLDEIANQFVFYTADSIYKMDLQGNLLAEKNALPDPGKPYERFKKGDLAKDPYFELSELKTGNIQVVEQLAKDLQLKLVNDKKKARRAVFFTLTLNAAGSFDFIEIDAAVILDLEKGKWGQDENLKKALTEKLKSYTYDPGTVPEGLPYRTFSGKMYLLK